MKNVERKASHLVLGMCGSLLVGSPSMADETGERHGTVTDHKVELAVEGGLTAVAQTASDDRAEDDFFASFDLVSTIPMGPGVWTVYVEGNTSLHADHVSGVLGEANADAGSALDRDGKDRFQVSEFHYGMPLAGAQVAVGLIDATGYLDTSDLANDETSQFLSAELVNNPTIGFPDYTLGGVYHRELGESAGMTVFLGGSHGLADHPDASYSQLFHPRAEVGGMDKGVFAAVEGFWQGSATVRVGVWTNTAEHAKLDGSGDDDSNYGLYGVVDWQVGDALLNLRLGLANEDVSPAATFLSLAAEFPAGPAAVGAGIAHTGASDEDATLEDILHAELYARFELAENFHLTPSVQWLQNSGFDDSETSYDKDITLFSLRAGYSF